MEKFDVGCSDLSSFLHRDERRLILRRDLDTVRTHEMSNEHARNALRHIAREDHAAAPYQRMRTAIDHGNECIGWFGRRRVGRLDIERLRFDRSGFVPS